MKILRTIAAVALLLAAKQASATVDVSAFGGFTTFNMKAVNDTLDTIADGIKLGGFGFMENSRINNGYYAGVDGLFTLTPGLKAGARVEMLMPNSAKLRYTQADETRIDTSLILPEIGVATEFPINGNGLSMELGAWIGYGLGYGSVISSMTAHDPNTDNFSGWDVMGEGSIKIKYRITHLISAGLDLGYRFANVRKMFFGADNLISGVKSGNVLRDSSNDDLPFDFGGKNIGLDVNFSF